MPGAAVGWCHVIPGSVNARGAEDPERLALPASSRRLILLTGKKRAGKDTVGKYLVQQHGFTRLAFADPVKDLALAIDPLVGAEVRLSHVVGQLGWDVAKQESEIRRLLQRIGTEGGRGVLGKDVWIKILADKVMETTSDVIITDCRFVNEADWGRLVGGTVVKIVQSSLGSGDDHRSEVELNDITPDYWIVNDGPVSELHKRIDKLLQRL